MSKTVFVDGNAPLGIPGTLVMAAFLNALNNHRHMGTDVDGDGALDYAVTTGSANAYALALVPALTTYIPGMPIYFKASFSNTGPATLAINGLTPLSLKKNLSDDVVAGDIVTGRIYMALYDGTAIQIISALPNTVSDQHGVSNLKPVINAAVNTLDIFAKSSGAAPDANNPISPSIPDGTGFTKRTRTAAYLSGTTSFTLADATGYWGYASLEGSQYPIYLYAIWDGTGIVWALSGNPNLEKVTTTTTATDKDYMLLEASSTYSRNASHYCQLVGWLEAEYNTADTPDWTIKAGSCGVGAAAPKYLTDVGKVRIDFSGKAQPGELEIDGSSLVRATYARLYTHFGGAIYGAADSSHFYLANPRGRFLRIWDHAAAVDPDRASRTDRGDGTTGDNVGTKQAGVVESHVHAQTCTTSAGACGGGAGVIAPGGQNTGAYGGNETRPINMNVALFVRY